jgi:hypothetical protein
MRSLVSRKSRSEQRAMQGVNEKERITRREIFELSSAALATAGVLGGVNTAKAAQDSGKNAEPAKPGAALTTGKIALEEHFALSEIAGPYAQAFSPEVWRQLKHSLEDMGSERIAEMDRGGVEFCILSLTAPAFRPFPMCHKPSPPQAERTTIWPSTSRSTPTV